MGGEVMDGWRGGVLAVGCWSWAGCSGVSGDGVGVGVLGGEAVVLAGGGLVVGGGGGVRADC